MTHKVRKAMGEEIPWGPGHGWSWVVHEKSVMVKVGLVSLVPRGSCFLEELPRILAAAAVASLEAEGPGSELSIPRQVRHANCTSHE